MFSFRTTSLEDQLDKSLQEGKVGCFCTQNCWDTEKGRYMYDIFHERGNLEVIFSPRAAASYVVAEFGNCPDVSGGQRSYAAGVWGSAI